MNVLRVSVRRSSPRVCHLDVFRKLVSSFLVENEIPVLQDPGHPELPVFGRYHVTMLRIQWWWIETKLDRQWSPERIGRRDGERFIYGRLDKGQSIFFADSGPVLNGFLDQFCSYSNPFEPDMKTIIRIIDTTGSVALSMVIYSFLLRIIMQ